MSTDRRRFLQQMGGLAAGYGALSAGLMSFAKDNTTKPLFFEISLAQWSLHKALFAKQIDNLDFPGIAKNTYGISIVEYVNQFFKDKAKDEKYLGQLLRRCKDNGVKNHLIMCDGEGDMGDLDKTKRMTAVENHYKWVDAAKFLGCITIRVNAFGVGTPEEVAKAAAESLTKLGEYGSKLGINIIVENHGGITSNGQWLSGVMKSVNRKNVGTLPDFGNFCVKRDGKGMWDGKCIEEYDRYKGTAEMMPFAKGVSAKTHDFDKNGNCIETDYMRMMKVVKDAGFRGYAGIEYEGDKISEEEGIKKTKLLLEKVGAALA